MEEEKKARRDEPEATEEEKPAKKLNPMILLALGLLFGAVVSSAAVFFVMKSKHSEAPVATDTAESTDDKKSDKHADDKKDNKKDDKHDKEAESKEPLVYLPLAQPFLVLLQPNEKDGVGKYLQLSITVSIRGEALKKAITDHDPLIRNDVVMVLSKYTDKQALSAEGRKKMQEDVLVAINSVLKKETKGTGVDGVLFVQLVVQ